MSYDDMLEEPGISDFYSGKIEPLDGLLGDDEDMADEDKGKLPIIDEEEDEGLW